MVDLKVDRVSKKYRVRHALDDGEGGSSLLARLKRMYRRSEEFWAVRDVSFEVERGETLGIIGHNGAGKSTILKLLSSITAPSEGEISINGRLSALIEVGSGFHPELTGRENVYLSGSILGMRRREITEKLDSIIDFAGVRQFIDTPVKRYSSGMYVRLGFSIAAHLEPDILLLDEVLAVGDAAFQAKCLRRIKELHASGTTIVFISHDLGAVERLCSRVLLMQRGEIVTSGPARDVIAEYQERASKFMASTPQMLAHTVLTKEAEITSVTFHDEHGDERPTFRTGQPLTVNVHYLSHATVPHAVFEVYFTPVDTADGLWSHLSTAMKDDDITLEPGVGRLEFRCQELGLPPGLYAISAAITTRGTAYGTGLDWHPQCATVRVDPGKVFRGSFYIPFKSRLIDSHVEAAHTGTS